MKVLAATLFAFLVQGCAGPRISNATPQPALDGVVDLSDRKQNPFANKDRALVLIFISIECPISNRYAPEIQRLQNRYAKEGVTFWLVQPTTDETIEQTRQYLERFGYNIGLLRDPRHTLVKLAKASVTPEAAVFTAGGSLAYHGRIDDRYEEFGKTRRAPTKHELKSALEELLAGRPITVSTAPAIGCSIPRNKNRAN